MENPPIRAQEISRLSNMAISIAASPATIGSWKTAQTSTRSASSVQQSFPPPRPLGVVCAGKFPVKSVKDLQGKRIATEVVNLTKRYLKKNGVKAEWNSLGRTKSKPTSFGRDRRSLETGSSLRANKLRIVDETLEFAAPHCQPPRRGKQMEGRRSRRWRCLSKGARRPETKVGLKMKDHPRERRCRVAEESSRCGIRRLPTSVSKGLGRRRDDR